MKIILAAIFLISTAFAYPVGDSDESKSSASIINPNSLSVAKSEESGEIHDHNHDEAHKDVSHENQKEVHQHSSETSEESSESNEKPEEKPQINEATPIPHERKAEDERLLDVPEKPKISEPESQASEIKEEKAEEPAAELQKNEEPLLDEKSIVGEPEVPALKSLAKEKIDIIEAANKPAAIAEESSALEQKPVEASEGKIGEKHLPLPASISEEKSIPEGKEIDENPIENENAVKAEIISEAKEELPKKIEPSKEVIESELKLEGKSELDAIDAKHEIKEDEKADQLKESIVKTEAKEDVEPSIHKDDGISIKKEESVKVLGQAELPSVSEQSPSKSENPSSSS